jgi:hypothetical protein
MEILDVILRKQHREVGLYLDEDEHNLFLKLKGQVCPLCVWSATGATVSDILEQADQHYNWIKSGIEFGHSA